MNIFESSESIAAYFPESSPKDIKINLDGQSNSGKAGRSVRLHERVPLTEINDAERKKYFRIYSGKQLYHNPETVAPLDGQELFSDDTGLSWDYGCGRGERIIELASQNPGERYVGVDLHYRSLALGIRAAASAELDNVQFIRADASLLAPFIPGKSAVATSVMFPAPLPNKQGGFDGMPSQKLTQNIHRTLEKDGSPFEFSSDSAPYFNYRMRQIGSLGLFSCTPEELGVSLDAASHPTRYQKIWESKGIPTYSAVLRKVPEEGSQY